MDIDNTLNRLYKKEQSNAYIASFASVLAEFSTHVYTKYLIERHKIVCKVATWLF